MDTAGTADTPSVSFWMDDDRWSVVWPAAIAFAMLFHGFAFVSAAHAPARKAQERPVEMAIALPPPPPPEIAPVPEPEKPKPKPKKIEVPPDLPPPPNETPPEAPPEEIKPVTGVTADSVVETNAGGPSVRVGNTTFGNPDEEPFTKPEDVQRPTAQPFDLNAYRSSVIAMVNKEKRYPRKAKVLGLMGRCVVKIMVDREGNLVGEPAILGKGTGHDVLDAEAIRMVKARSPYPPVIGDAAFPVRLNIPIEFTILDP